MCVFVCQGKQAASCQRGGVIGPGGFEHSRPAKLTVCLDNGIFPSPSPSLHPSACLPLLKIAADRKAPPLLLHFCQRVSIPFLYLHSASISQYLPSSILFIEESPPTSPPAEQPHYHQSASSLPLGGDWYQHPRLFLASLSSPTSVYTLSPPLSLFLWHPLLSFLFSTLSYLLTLSLTQFIIVFFFFLRPQASGLCSVLQIMIKIHY